SDWRFRQISAIRDGLFRLIFTCESSQPYAARNPAQVRFTEYDHVVEAVPSQSLPAGGTLRFSGRLRRKMKDPSTDEVLGRRSRPFRLSATREDRCGAGPAPAVEAHGKQDRGDAAEERDAGDGGS